MYTYSPNSDVYARYKHTEVELTRQQALKRNSFPSVNDNPKIDAEIKRAKERMQ